MCVSLLYCGIFTWKWCHTPSNLKGHDLRTHAWGRLSHVQCFLLKKKLIKTSIYDMLLCHICSSDTLTVLNWENRRNIRERLSFFQDFFQQHCSCGAASLAFQDVQKRHSRSEYLSPIGSPSDLSTIPEVVRNPLMSTRRSNNNSYLCYLPAKWWNGGKRKFSKMWLFLRIFPYN